MTGDPETPRRLPSAMHRFMNGDGEPHPLENALAVGIALLSLASVVCLFLRAWNASGWLALVAGLLAAYDEFIAKTSGQRWLILTGFAVCLICLAVSMANGGILGIDVAT